MTNRLTVLPNLERRTSELFSTHRKEISITPSDFTPQQIERYRQMTGEVWLLIALILHEMPCEIARDGIRARYLNATPEAVELKLRERLRLAYQSGFVEAVSND